MVTLRPRASKIAPSEAAAIPLPSEDTTPPVTNTIRFMLTYNPFGKPANRVTETLVRDGLLGYRGTSCIPRDKAPLPLQRMRNQTLLTTIDVTPTNDLISNGNQRRPLSQPGWNTVRLCQLL